MAIMSIRAKIFGVLLIVTLFGILAKSYAGPGRQWVNNLGPASIAYEVFFMLLAFLFIPRRRAITTIAITVCTATCAVEFLQLWKPPWLQALRGFTLGKAVLGHSFSWLDFPAYPIGCLIGWFLLHRLAGPQEDVNLPH